VSRRPLVAGNWKMHLLAAEARQLCEGLRAGRRPPAVDVVVFPSFPLLPVAATALAGSGIACGGQDLSPHPPGAHTGDVAAAQLVDAGAAWALAGHSERRRDHGETDDAVATKVAAACAAGLLPVLCLGERAEERRAGDTLAVLGRQLAAIAEPPPGLVVAYEPVWAIGTGDTATPEQAQQAHAFLRRRFADLAGPRRADSLRILYGGSVKPDNAAELAACPDIDGFLVGGASLDAHSFLSIIQAFA